VPGTHRPVRAARLRPRLPAAVTLAVAASALALLPASTAAAVPGDAVVQRTYRLALLNDPTYAAAVAPGAASPAESDAQVLAAKQTLIDQLNAIFSPELAIRFELAPGSVALNLDTAAEATGANGPCGTQGCFTTAQLATTGPGCNDDLMLANRNVTGQLIGAHNYDIGHLLLGYAGGASSYAQSAGIEFRAYGCSASAAPSGPVFVVDILARELARQLGANPTSDSLANDLCANEYSPDTAVEPGSGSSIMSLAGRCGAEDLQPHADPYFSTVSQDQIATYVNGGSEFVPPDATAAEVQSVALRDFGSGDSFRLSFDGAQTAVIEHGVNYTASDIRSAVLATIPSAALSKVRAFWNSGLTIDERGFEMTFASFTNVVNPTVVPVSGSFTAIVNDLDEGGLQRLGGTPTATANRSPVVSVPPSRTIPMRTPFALTGSATDADGDALTFQWQQINLGGGVALAAPAKTGGPLFRMETPTVSPTRSFPDLAQVLVDNTTAATGTCPAGPAQIDCLAEWLPGAEYADDLHFSLVARDSNPLGGGVSFTDLTLGVDTTVSPFRVTSQATPQSATGGDPLTVTWTAGTAGLAAQVRILLSVDGGLTFPTVLAAATPNDGAHTVTLPDVDTATGRLKVEAIDNYFYDVSHANLTIEPAPSGLTLGELPDDVVVQHTDGTDVAFGAETSNGDSGLLSAEVTSGALPAGLAVARIAASAEGVEPGTAQWGLTGTVSGAPGEYPVEIGVSDGVADQTFPLLVTVTPESATATYQGPTEVAAPTAGDDAVEIDLTATVTEEVDATPGSLSTATLRFTDTATDEVLCVADPVVTVTPGSGTAGCTMSADLGPDPRTYVIALELGGAWTGGSASSTDLVVSPPPPSLVVTGMPTSLSVDHTDAPTLGFQASTTAGDAAVLDAAIVAGALPAGVTLAQTDSTGDGEVPGEASYALTGTVSGLPGAYPVTIEVTDGALTRTYDVAITVTPEDATVSYDGPTEVAAPTGGPDAVTLSLSATLAEIEDTSSGSLVTATATFRDEATGQTLCADVPVDGGTGVAECDHPADLPAFGGRTYQVAVDIGGAWTGTTTEAVEVVVTSPDPAPAPQTTITAAPREWLLTDRTTVRFAASQVGAQFTCTLDGAIRPCASGALVLSALTPGTHRVTVTAVNAEGTPDPTPAATEFTVPLDDRALRTRGKGWQRAKAGKAYEKTVTQTSRRRAELSYHVTGATALALVVARAPSYGKVTVFLGKRKLKTINLRGKRAYRKVVTVARFSTPTSGRVRIVTTTGKQVRIDGLGVRTAEI
jgi:hypothetical protein